MVLSTACFLVRGDIMKMNKMVVAVAALTGMGALWMMYQKKNPNALEDMKQMTKEAAGKMLTKLENMD